jgi:hypothetical protein
MSPNMLDFVETILRQLAKTEDLSLLRPESTQAIYNKTVKEGKCRICSRNCSAEE